jgi:hypothetical protein
MALQQGADPAKLIGFWRQWLAEGDKRRRQLEQLQPQERTMEQCPSCCLPLAHPLGQKGREEVAAKGLQACALVRGVLIGIEFACMHGT